MTCIVGIEAKNEVWLGTDSFVGDENLADIIDRPKWFQKGPMMLAYAGDFRAAQVVEHVAKFRPRKRGEDPIHYLVSGVVKVIHKAVSEAGVKVTSKGDYGTSFLIALSGKLYLLQEDGSVIRSRNGYSSIGWGEAYALGALAALKSREDPKTCLEESLQIAANLCPQIRGPFHVASFR